MEGQSVLIMSALLAAIVGGVLLFLKLFTRTVPAGGVSGKMDEQTPEHDAEERIVDLAVASLADLFQFQELKTEQWYVRVSAGGHARGWELLTSDSEENRRAIKQRVRESEMPVTDLVVAFLGHIPWRGSEQLMVIMHYFRRGDPEGLLFGSHVKQTLAGGKLEPDGSFLSMGLCENTWI